MSSNTDENQAPAANTSIETHLKRPATKKANEPATKDTSEPAAKRSCSETETEVLDLAETLGYKVGDRFEVKWEVQKDGDEEDNNNIIEHWWAATLLEHDGRTADSVAIRVLDYDPFPEGGFPERSKEDVIFMGRDTLVNPETCEELTYRIAGTSDEDDEAPIYLRRDNVEEIVNATLQSAMAKNSEAWSRLAPAQQAMIASSVAEKKKKLVELLLNFPGGVISPADMQAILSKTMQEDKK